MLGKVMKYEFKSVGRILLPFFALSLGLSLVAKIVTALTSGVGYPAKEIVSAFSGLVIGLLPIVIVLLTCVLLLIRFYQSMSGNEGYLSFTLPVKTSTHILARLLTGVLTILVSVVVAMAGVCLYVPFSAWGTVAQVFAESQIPGYILAWFIGMMLVFIIVGIVNFLLHIYASIAIGTQFSGHRILGGVGGYFLLNIVSSIIGTILMLLPLARFIGMDEAMMESQVSAMVALSNGAGSAMPVWDFIGSVLGELTMVFGFMLAVLLIISIGYYVLTWFFFSRKMNLE